MIRRPCIDRLPDGRACPNYAIPDKSRCEQHELAYQRTRKASPSSTAIKRDRSFHRFRQRHVSAIAAGDHVECGICGDPITNVNGKTDPDGLVIDHVIAVADGGDGEQLQPAHRRCNASKSGGRRRPRTPGQYDAAAHIRRTDRPPWMSGD